MSAGRGEEDDSVVGSTYISSIEGCRLRVHPW